MASKRAVSVLRPAVNGSGPRLLRAECAQRAHYTTRTLSSQASRPRKLAQHQHQQQQQQQQLRYASSGAGKEQLGKTDLYELHSKYGAKFVPFGGYSMPVQYSDLSIVDSHNWTREKASLFDVGHMVQHHFSGPGAEAFLESITPSSLSSLPQQQSTLSTLLHPETGGIVDDTVIARLADKFYVVTNAGCREKDTAYFKEQLEAWKSAHSDMPVEWNILQGQGLVALQGPLSAEILSRVLDDTSKSDLKSLYFGQCVFATITGTDAEVLVSRAGYTGEDGFEISIPSYATEAVTQFLLDSAKDELRFAGLGARDTLRLEAGMCLYGHDLDDTTTPVEGALSWIIGKDRRAKGGFHGDSVILQQLKKKSEGGGVSRRRIGLIVEGSPAREGAEIVNEAGEKIGNITSGCPSPTLKKNIAMGYIKDGMHKAGTEVDVVVRGKKRKAVVTKMPFVPSKYYKTTHNGKGVVSVRNMPKRKHSLVSCDSTIARPITPVSNYHPSPILSQVSLVDEGNTPPPCETIDPRLLEITAHTDDNTAQCLDGVHFRDIDWNPVRSLVDPSPDRVQPQPSTPAYDKSQHLTPFRNLATSPAKTAQPVQSQPRSQPVLDDYNRVTAMKAAILDLAPALFGSRFTYQNACIFSIITARDIRNDQVTVALIAYIERDRSQWVKVAGGDEYWDSLQLAMTILLTTLEGMMADTLANCFYPMGYPMRP